MSPLGLVILVHLMAISSFADNGIRHSRSYAPSRDNLVTDNVFATSNCTVVTAQLGSSPTLPCTVRKFSNGVITWIRRKDYQILTVGLLTYSSDDRFFLSHARHLQSWGLQIRQVQKSDEGWYECQMSTHPPTSIFVELKITEATSEVLGAPDVHLKSGSALRLVCRLLDSTEPPVYVFWYHDSRMINYDELRGVTVEASAQGSTLSIAAARREDSGNYTCAPSNARAASIVVHVLEEEKPAAMQHDSRSCGAHLSASLLLLVMLCLLAR